MQIGDTNIHADRFVNGASAVLISHYHRDHLSGMRRWRAAAPVLCSPLTARLLIQIDRFDPAFIKPISLGETVRIAEGTEKIMVKALEANHCPGSVMFVLEWQGQRAIYTGDFRLNDRMRKEIAEMENTEILYLDQTYNQPRYVFPPQEKAVEQVLSHMRKRGGREVFVAVYSIGKNRILEAAYEEFGLPFYTTDEKRRIYEVAGMGHLVTADRDATPFRAYGRGYLERYFRMTETFRDGNCIVIIPTGWATELRSRGVFRYVPYSEHCDHKELAEFCKLVQPRHIVPING